MQWPWKKDFKVLKVDIIFTVGMQLFLPKLSHSACDLESGPANTLRWSNPRVTAGNKLCKCQRSTAAFGRLIFWRNKLNPSFLVFFFYTIFKMPQLSTWSVFYAREQKYRDTRKVLLMCKAYPLSHLSFFSSSVPVSPSPLSLRRHWPQT